MKTEEQNNPMLSLQEYEDKIAYQKFKTGYKYLGINLLKIQICEQAAELYASQYKEENARLREALETISNIQELRGRYGCTYGDTPHDSLAAAYGYNECLFVMQQIVNKALQPKK